MRKQPGSSPHSRVVSRTSVSSTDTVYTSPEGEIQNKGFLAKEWIPKGDELDRKIMGLWVPAIANFLLIPLVGAADVFWVGRMGEVTSLAAQGAADRVFSSAFWTISFLPSLVTPLVAKAAAAKDTEEVQRLVGEAIFVAIVVGLAGMLFITQMPGLVLGVAGVTPGTAVFALAAPYLFVRGLTFIPAIVATVGFSAFRGTMDVMTPLKITLFTQTLNVVLDPVFIFGLGPLAGLGVTGAALATAMSEIAGCASYTTLMIKRKMATLRGLVRVPTWSSLAPLLVGGLAIQLRSLALNLGLLSVSRATMMMDPTGTAAAAHAITVNLWQVAGVVLLALSSAATILIPRYMMAAEEDGGLLAAKRAGDRLLAWGLVGGVGLGCMQFFAIPLLGVFTPLADVQEAARLPAMMAAAQQAMNGVAFVAEGMMQGHQAFGKLAVNTGLAMMALLVVLEEGLKDTLLGVWGGFWVFNGFRLVLALHHHYIGGPLAPRNLRKKGIMI